MVAAVAMASVIGAAPAMGVRGRKTTGRGGGAGAAAASFPKRRTAIAGLAHAHAATSTMMAQACDGGQSRGRTQLTAAAVVVVARAGGRLRSSTKTTAAAAAAGVGGGGGTGAVGGIGGRGVGGVRVGLLMTASPLGGLLPMPGCSRGGAAGGNDAAAAGSRGASLTAGATGGGGSNEFARRGAGLFEDVMAVFNRRDDPADADTPKRPNRWKNIAAVFGRFLLLVCFVPFVIAQCMKSCLVTPWLAMRVANDHGAHGTIHLSHHQEEVMAMALAKYEDVEDFKRFAHGRPPMADAERTQMMVSEAHRLEKLAKAQSFEAIGNVIGSGLYIAVTAAVVTNQRENVRALLGELQEDFFGMDALTQALILLLLTDIVVGYHSADGWQAVLCCVVTHYGRDFEHWEMFVRLFSATVPVSIDVAFKYWVFTKLRRLSPSSQIILEQVSG